MYHDNIFFSYRDEQGSFIIESCSFQEASQNNGVVDYHKVAHHHYPDLQLSKAKTDVRYHVISGVTHTENALSSFHGSPPSFCCTIYINPLFGIVRSNYLHEFLDFFVVVVFHV